MTWTNIGIGFWILVTISLCVVVMDNRRKMDNMTALLSVYSESIQGIVEAQNVQIQNSTVLVKDQGIIMGLVQKMMKDRGLHKATILKMVRDVTEEDNEPRDDNPPPAS